MDFALTLLKAFGVVFGLGGGGMILSAIIMILYVKQASKGRMYAVFYEKSREIAGELITIGVNDNPERFQSPNGGEYVIDAKKTWWYYWPPGFPRFVQQPIPALSYLRNDPSPIDPDGSSEPSVTAMSLQYMMDEAFLRTTWRDAKDAIDEERVTGKNNILIWMLAATIGLLVVGLYFGWQSYNHLSELLPLLGA